MEYFRQINRQTLLILSLLILLSLLTVQGVNLHVHSLDHGHGDHQSHVHMIDEADGHSHLSKAHFTHDTSHNDHHGGSISEIDISSDGVLKKASSSIFAIALIIFLLALLIFAPSRQLIVGRWHERKLFSYRYYSLSPPLRAPPQH